nr:hypothetical protein [Tanacetum cinerariifolium]
MTKPIHRSLKESHTTQWSRKEMIKHKPYVGCVLAVAYKNPLITNPYSIFATPILAITLQSSLGSCPETTEKEFMNAPIGWSTLQALSPIRQYTGTFYESKIRDQLPLKKRYRETPYDPFTDTTPRPRPDDPYALARDAAVIVPTREDDENPAVPSDTQIMPPRRVQPFTQAVVDKLIKQRVDAAIKTKRERVRSARPTEGPAQDPVTATPSCVSHCAKRNKNMFAAASFQGRALTWWNSQVATLGLEVTSEKSWTDMKTMMTEEFCPSEEIQRMEEKKKTAAYIRGLSDNIKGEVTSSEPTTLSAAVCMANTLME